MWRVLMMRKILSDSQIREIKKKYNDGRGVRQNILAKEYGVSIMTISLWLKDNPYEVLYKKKRKAVDYSGKPRCKVCTRILEYEDQVCDCRKPKKYFSELDDLSNFL